MKRSVILFLTVMFLTVLLLWLAVRNGVLLISALTVVEVVGLVIVLFASLIIGSKCFWTVLVGSTFVLTIGYALGSLVDIGNLVQASGTTEVLINAFMGSSLLLAIAFLILWIWFIRIDVEVCGTKSPLLQSAIMWVSRVAAGVVFFIVLNFVFYS